MRWIVTADYWGDCLGMGEDPDGVPTHGTPEQADALPMEFWLCDPKENVVLEGRCGDIQSDWWHGFEPLIATWNTFRCRRLYYPALEAKNPGACLSSHKPNAKAGVEGAPEPVLGSGLCQKQWKASIRSVGLICSFCMSHRPRWKLRSPAPPARGSKRTEI